MTTLTPTDGSAAHPFEPTDGPLTFDELKMAYRCPAMPLEALRYDITPVGLHYQVVHFEIPNVSTETWSVDIDGLVERPLRLSLADIKSRPAVTMPVMMECAGNGRALLEPRPVSGPWLAGGIGHAEWTGTPLKPLLAEAGILDSAIDVVFTGADYGIQGGIEQAYERGLAVDDAMQSEVLLAYAMNGRPLEPQHGAPMRLLVPGWYGMASVKWLVRIRVIGQRYDGYQNAVAYRYQASEADPGSPVTRQRIKSLMTPPGISEMVTDRRTAIAGQIRLTGRAWSGFAPVERVEVSVDDVWSDARLEPIGAPGGWRAWTFDWEAHPGERRLACRATDASGQQQPLDPAWNYQGMGNNAIQRLAVTVVRR